MIGEEIIPLLQGEKSLISEEIETLYHSLKKSREWELSEHENSLTKSEEAVADIKKKLEALKDKKSYLLTMKVYRFLRKKQLQKELSHYEKKVTALQNKCSSIPIFSKETHPNKTLRKLLWKQVLVESMISDIESGENPNVTLDFVEKITSY